MDDHVSCVSFQNRSSSRRRAEPVNIEDQDKPYVCDSKGKENFILCTCTILRSVRLQSLYFLRAELLCSPEIWLLREKTRVSIYIYFKALSLLLRAVLCSMKKEFAVNPDLTSMPLSYLDRIPQ